MELSYGIKRLLCSNPKLLRHWSPCSRSSTAFLPDLIPECYGFLNKSGSRNKVAVNLIAVTNPNIKTVSITRAIQ